MSLKVPRLAKNRHGVYYVRAIFFDLTGKRHIQQHSLSTKNSQEARALALKFNLNIEERRMNIKNFSNSLRLHPDGSIEADLTKPEELAFMERLTRKSAAKMEAEREAMRAQERAWAMLPHVKPLAKAPLFSQATKDYLSEKAMENAAATIKSKQSTFKDFIATYGDLDINHISKAEIVAWKTSDLKRGLGANRINKRLGQMNDFFMWAVNHGHYTAHNVSPVDGLFISSRSKLAKNSETREPFGDDEIKAIFGAGYKERMFAPDHYWVPLVCLFSGARLNEVANLQTSSVSTVDGVPCFQIEKGKTKDSRRVVPIHQMLISLGFLTYCEAMKAAGHAHLFPHRPEGSNGRGKEAGREFSIRLRKDCQITSKRKTLHSTRHTVITRLHGVDANPAHTMQITGHSEEVRGVHYKTYTHSMGLKELEQTLNRLTYPHDFADLKLADPTFSAFFVKLNSRGVDEKKAAKDAIKAKHLAAKAKREEWNKLPAKKRTPSKPVL
jgi:integrase